MGSNLFERIGGAPAVDAAVDIFYKKVTVDGRISHFFDGMEMARLKAHQKAFLTLAFGGPNTYGGRGMREAHASLVSRGLNAGHFDAVVENLVATLQELKVPPAEIAEIGTIAGSVRADVLGL